MHGASIKRDAAQGTGARACDHGGGARPLPADISLRFYIVGKSQAVPIMIDVDEVVACAAQASKRASSAQAVAGKAMASVCRPC
eukprot:COSAG01_NODE_21979_length_877_cov_1.071979_1_plen_84_part_00